MKHGWEYKKLGDCFSYIKNGANIKQDKSGLGFPITRIETLSSGRFNRDKVGFAGITDIEKYRAYVLNDKDLLMSHINSKAYIGRTVLYRKEGDESIIHGMNLLRLVANEKIDSCYFAALAQSTYFKEQIAKIRKDAVNQSSFAISDLQKIQIPVPPLPVQEQICSLLDKLNLVIEKKKEQIAELDNLSQSLFYDMFGDPTINEKGWEVKKMGDFGSFQRGLLLQKKDFVENGCPCIHYGQLHTSFGAYTTKHLTNISQELFSKSKIAHKGDLILALTSEDVEGSCKSTAWLGGYDIAVGSDAAIFSHNQDGIYLSFYTRTRAFYNEKDKYARGFKVTHIKTSDIATFPICLPPLPLQQAFAEKVKAIEQQKELINQSIKDVQTLFDAKMDYYFGD